MAGNKARIGVRLDGDDSGLKSAFSRSSANASAWASKMRGVGKAVGAAFTIGAIAQIGRKMLTETDRIADLAANLQISSDALQAFEGVARTAGAGVDKLDSSLEKLQQVQGNIASGEGEKAAASLAALGLSAEDALLPIERLFQKIAEGFASTGNVGALDELFGKGAVRLSNTLREIAKFGSLENLIFEQGQANRIIASGEVGRAGGIMDWGIDKGAQGLKWTTSMMTPGADDLRAKAEQEANIRAGVEQRKQIADAAAESARAEKRAELEKIISGAKGESGLGSELVRIGARGGIAGGESPAVKLAKESLAALNKVVENTEPIADISTGTFTPP